MAYNCGALSVMGLAFHGLITPLCTHNRQRSFFWSSRRLCLQLLEDGVYARHDVGYLAVPDTAADMFGQLGETFRAPAPIGGAIAIKPVEE